MTVLLEEEALMTMPEGGSLPLEVVVAGDVLISLVDPGGLQELMTREVEGGGPSPWVRAAWGKQLRRVLPTYRTPVTAGLLLKAAGREEGKRERSLTLWGDASRLEEVWRGEGLLGHTYDEGPLATSWEGLPASLRALVEEDLLVEVAPHQREG